MHVKIAVLKILEVLYPTLQNIHSLGFSSRQLSLTAGGRAVVLTQPRCLSRVSIQDLQRRAEKGGLEHSFWCSNAMPGELSGLLCAFLLVPLLTVTFLILFLSPCPCNCPTHCNYLVILRNQCLSIYMSVVPWLASLADA